jgi:hypothetical protein
MFIAGEDGVLRIAPNKGRRDSEMSVTTVTDESGILKDSSKSDVYPEPSGEDIRYLQFTEGKHRWKFSNGDTYLGMWKDGRMHGRGTLAIKKNGELYEGYFEENLFNGEGTFVHQNGEVFKGHFMNGSKHGAGKVDFINGVSMKGVWNNGKQESLTGGGSKTIKI